MKYTKSTLHLDAPECFDRNLQLPVVQVQMKTFTSKGLFDPKWEGKKTREYIIKNYYIHVGKFSKLVFLQ